LYPRVDIQRITTKNGVATGATGYYHTPDGNINPVTIHADTVVVSSGALHTPVLLLKSGLQHPQIGQNLYLHPVAATAALMPHETHSWYGPMMSVIVREFERLEGNWGVRLECPPLHPGLAAFALNWEDGRTFKSMMTGLNRLAVNIALTRDKFGGKVTVGKQSGKPLVHYTLHEFDKKHLLKGLQEAVRLHEAAGAEHIVIPHNQSIHYFPGQEPYADCLLKIQQRKWRSNDFGLFSAHQMGTCRMGGSAREPVKPNGETREIQRLFVADGSLFPSASGVNPMLSIQALAYHVAQHV
jgi:choline dehydrogenase-like flavoprotein